MPHNDSNPQEDSQTVSAVDFVNHYNSEIEGFEVELTLRIDQYPDESVIYAGIMVQMGRSGEQAFIPSNALRQLADEADAMAQKAVDDANARNG